MLNNLSIAITESLDKAKQAPQTQEEGQLKLRWTTKRFVDWLKQKYDLQCSRETCRVALKQLGFSWKKARKLLNKANSKVREAFVDKLQALLQKATLGEHLLIYMDEAHIHLDADEGYGWSVKGEPFWVSSSSPGRAKVSFFGVYLYNKAQVRMYPYDTANGINTIAVLKKIRQEQPDIPIVMIWDGASYHRSLITLEAAKKLNIDIQKLPAYSPDFMPVEHLWQWLREDVTYHTCHPSKEVLIQNVQFFEENINLQPHQVANRLWVKNSIEPALEKLRFSN